MNEYFSENGPLSKSIDRYKYRREQVDMSLAVSSALDKESILVAEAGTGTGKTFAYLVPVLLKECKTIISTGTKTLQDQLFLKDIPRVKKALGLKNRISLLKGRSNYVCHYYLDRTKSEGRFRTKVDLQNFIKIEEYARFSNTGDKTLFADVSENAEIWNSVVSSRDNCLGSDCEFHDKCFVIKARADAMNSDMVVVNHHLFFADILLRDVGLSELLPDCQAVVFDEAHLLPEIASLFFGDSISTNQIMELVRDSRREILENAGDSKRLRKSVDLLENSIGDICNISALKNDRYPQSVFFTEKNFLHLYESLLKRLTNLKIDLEDQKERSTGLMNCMSRATLLIERLRKWEQSEENEGEKDDEETVSWLETFTKSLHFNRTPLNVAKVFKNHLESRSQTWVFTSATLSVNKDFSHYIGQLGLETAVTKSWDSPYDYGNNARLFLPHGLPEPNDENYTEKAVDRALPLILAAGGRTFFLFTSARAMQKADLFLRNKLNDRGYDFPILVQGMQPKSILLDKFRKLGNAILIGTMSFWEGVDVRGKSLSLVIIDRVPFGRPDDPVLAARIRRMRKLGFNPFIEYQLPKAILTLKQGAGRLIRDDDDKGVLMICDPRLVSKSYGKKIWNSLPAMTRLRDMEYAKQFLQDSAEN